MNLASHKSPIAVFIAAFVLLVLINYPLINMPPVWDAVSGAFAPATYLFVSDYDLRSLLAMAGYLDAGPNVHSLSLTTQLTYLFIKLTNGDPQRYLPALHVLHLVFAAVVVVVTYVFARSFLRERNALLLALVLLVFPLFTVQASYVYAEMPGAAFFACTVLAWAARRSGWMLLFFVLCCLTKSFGLVLAAFLLIVFLADRERAWWNRLIWGVTLVAVPVTFEVIKQQFEAGLGGRTISYRIYVNYLESLVGTLQQVPDLFLLLVGAVLIPVLYCIRQRLFTAPACLQHVVDCVSGDFRERVRLAVYLLPLGFIAFLLTVRFTITDFFPLPRYYVWVLPMLLLGFVWATKWLLERLPGGLKRDGNWSAMILSAILVVLAALQWLNQSGDFYPGSETAQTRFSVAERSFEFLDYFTVQQAAIDSAARNHRGRPVFATRGEVYFGSSEMFAYVETPIRDLRFVLHQPWDQANLGQYPQEFLLVDASSNQYHGQNVVQELILKAEARKKYTIETLSEHTSGPYTSAVYLIRKR